MSKDIQQIGGALKAKRKEMNLSLKEIENATSIRSFYLEAIEEGTIMEHIATIYAQGFLKQYASFLQVDVDQLIKENPKIFEGREEKHEFSYGIGTLEVLGDKGGNVKWLPSLLWTILSMAILTLAWYTAKFLGIL